MSIENKQSNGSYPLSEQGQDWIEDHRSALKDLRGGIKISQSKLAEKAGFDPSFVSRLENGSREPSREAAETLSAALESDEVQADRLLASAGYRGRGNTIPYNETGMLAVNAILLDPETPKAVAEYIRTILAALGGLALGNTPLHSTEE